MDKAKIRVGDYVGISNDSNLKGIVRYIGRLDDIGNENSVWSEWNQKWDGIISCSSKKGKLLWCAMNNVVLIKKGNCFMGKSKGGI